MEKSEEIKILIKKSEKCKEEGNFDRAIFWILNGLGKYPGEISLINMVKIIIFSMKDNLFKERNLNVAEQKLSWLGIFYQEQIPMVKSEDLEMIFTYMEELNNTIETMDDIAPNVPDSITQEKTKNEFEILLEEIEKTEHKFGVIPSDVKDIECEFEKFSQLSERIEMLSITTTKNKTANRVKYYLEDLIKAKQFANLLGEIEKTFKYIEKSLKKQKSVYLMQHADELIRQLVLLSISLDNERQIEAEKQLSILQLLNNEKEKTTVIIEREKSAKNFISKIKTKIDHLKDKSAVEEIPAIANEGESHKKILRIETIMKEIQNFRTKNTWCLTDDSMIELVNDIQKLIQQIRKNQQDRYNKWAISTITNALDAGKIAKNLVKMKKQKSQIGDAMIKHLGSIETNFLSFEINRMYSEVFEYLYKSLKGPKKKIDVDDSYKKLGVLKKMYETTKIDFASF